MKKLEKQKLTPIFRARAKNQSKVQFTSAPVTLHAVQPKELVVYAKETQTKEVEPESKYFLFLPLVKTLL